MAEKTAIEMMQTLIKALQAPKSKYQLVEVTDLKTGIITYNVCERGRLAIVPPVARGLSMEAAETLARELEEKEKP